MAICTLQMRREVEGVPGISLVSPRSKCWNTAGYRRIGIIKQNTLRVKVGVLVG
jgi:hypothetical protein